MKITLDSTILVRAFTDSGGLARRLLLTILEGDHVLVMSNEILAETSRVLRYPRMRARHGMSESRIYDYVNAAAVCRDYGPTRSDARRADPGSE